MKIQYKLMCPFCGSECKREEFNGMIFKAVRYFCKNESCKALISFHNQAVYQNPKSSDLFFVRRALGGDKK